MDNNEILEGGKSLPFLGCTVGKNKLIVHACVLKGDNEVDNNQLMLFF